MAIAISPRHTTDDVQAYKTASEVPTNLAIDIFLSQIGEWHLGVAREMIEKGISHSGFALLHLVTSYFETIAKYTDGYVDPPAGGRSSKAYFRKGLLMVFPEVGSINQQMQEWFLDDMYHNIRCGLYHGSLPRRLQLTRDSLRDTLGYDPHHRVVFIHPERFVSRVLQHFAAFASMLQDPAQETLRANFRTRFDSECEVLS